MKKILFLGACLWALGSIPVVAQTGGPEVLVVRIHQSEGYMMIAQPDGKVEEFHFNALGTRKDVAESSASFRNLFASFYQQGFTLKSTFEETRIATLIFVKEK